MSGAQEQSGEKIAVDSLDWQRVLFVTGLSGAGKTTALKTLEDIGWEVIDNFPIRLFPRLFNLPAPQTADSGHSMPLAIGFDTRTRGFRPDDMMNRLDELKARENINCSLLFLDCENGELDRRYNETRRRHPMAKDRPASAGIKAERTLMAPFCETAEYMIDTTHLSASDLQAEVRRKFAFERAPGTLIQISSFGYSRGVPHNADLMFDMRFLRNPHWVEDLRPKTGLDEDVSAYIEADPAYADATSRIFDLLKVLIPRYEADGKAYVNIAFGCTGGRHRSVHTAETMAKWLQEAGFSPTIVHRNLKSPVIEAQQERRLDRRDDSAR